MLRLITRHKFIKTSDLEDLISKYEKNLGAQSLKQPLMLYAGLSVHSIAQVIAAINLGLNVAFCPLREPVGVINSWLLGLGHAQELSKSFMSILRSSGTSAHPKNIAISLDAHNESAGAVCRYFNFKMCDVWALPLPLYHVSGLSIIFRALLKNAGVFLAPDHEALVYGLEAGLITHCSLVPAQLKRLLEEKRDLSRVKKIIIGGDALKSVDRDRALDRGWPLYESYGMCETASMIAVKKSGAGHKTHILAHADIRIGFDQEITIKAKSLFSGYWSLGKLAKPDLKDGYFASGDLSIGDFSELLISRKSNRIISGGENIQAEEVERILEQHEQILECVVVGISDDKMGARPLAYIKWLHEALDEACLREFLSQRLAAFKHPVSFKSYPEYMPEGLKKPRRYLSELRQSTI